MSSNLKWYNKNTLVAGTDEAGRGCLAGPVTAAAILLPNTFKNAVLNDSKQLSERKRIILKPILENKAISYGVAHVFEKDIDTFNILNASIMATVSYTHLTLPRICSV